MCVDGACASYRRIKNKMWNFEDQKQYYLKEGFGEEMSAIMANTYMIVVNTLLENEK